MGTVSEISHLFFLVFGGQDWEETVRSRNGLFPSVYLCPQFKVTETWCVTALTAAGDPSWNIWQSWCWQWLLRGEWNEGWVVTTGVLSKGGARMSQVSASASHQIDVVSETGGTFATNCLETVNLGTLVNCKITMSCRSVQSEKCWHDSQLHQFKYYLWWWGVIIL